jgi:hypothetical protein
MERVCYQRTPQGTVARRIGAEIVLVPIRQNIANLDSLYTLNPSAADLWDHLDTPQTSEALAAMLTVSYDVDPAQASADVAAFLAEMTSLGLVKGAADGGSNL